MANATHRMSLNTILHAFYRSDKASFEGSKSHKRTGGDMATKLLSRGSNDILCKGPLRRRLTLSSPDRERQMSKDSIEQEIEKSGVISLQKDPQFHLNTIEISLKERS